MNIILFGPPGSGKGTQGDKLSKNYNLFKVSTGDLLREEIKRNTELGKDIKKLVDKGSFVSDNIINNLVEMVISNEQCNDRLIFDGYPRNLDQAKKLDNLLKKNKQKISYVFNLKVEKDIIVKRILGRIVCMKCNQTFNKFFNISTKENHSCDPKHLKTRPDDNEMTINNRFETYNKITLPILEYYKKQNLLHEIDGMKEINVIYAEIRAFIPT